MFRRVSHRFSGWVWRIALLSVAASAACGSRDNLFVLDDEVGSGDGGAGGRAGGGNLGGNAGLGAHGGTVTFAGRGGSGAFAGNGGHGAFAGNGGSGTFAGNGGHGAFAGFAGTGTGNVSGLGGTSGFSCAACLAQNNGKNPCAVAQCDPVNNRCTVVPQAEGATCQDGNLCAQSQCRAGKCVEVSTLTCAQMPCWTASCEGTSGKCVASPQTGTACDDGDPCTTRDQCVMGTCTRGTAVTSCISNDKCCPAGCSINTDNDCRAVTPITLLATDRGWFEDNGLHYPNNKNTFTGSDGLAQYNSFFSFDLHGVTGTIVSAQLVLELESFISQDMAETASIWDVSESPAVLANSMQGLAIFSDLQSGSEYGQFTATSANVNSTIVTTLNAAAVAALNAARGQGFAVGVHLDTLSAQTQADQALRFSAETEMRTHQLILTVQ